MIENEIMRPPLITIVLAQLRGAGIQRMRLRLARELISRGYNVEILVGQKTGELVGKVPKGVSVVELSRKSKILFLPRIIAYMKRRRPLFILSSYEQISAMLIISKAIVRLDVTILTSFHNSPSCVLKEGSHLTRHLNSWAYKIISSPLHSKGKVVAVSDGVGKELSLVTSIHRDRIRTVYNPVFSLEAQRLSSAGQCGVELDGMRKTIGYFGRFHIQKRVDILLRAFQRMPDHEMYNLLLVGEGDLRQYLEGLARDLDIERYVTFVGFSLTPKMLMRECAVVVLPSDYEGFGNVLVEAMGCGTQVVATDCPYGPSEILQAGRYGQLVPVGDVEALSVAIDNCVNGRSWVAPEVLMERAKEFSVESSTDAYLDVLGLPRHWRSSPDVN